MNTQTETKQPESFIGNPKWFMWRGRVLLVLGCFLLFFSMISPDVSMVGVKASWLPLAAILIMVFGVLRCIDGFVAENTALTIMNAQNGLIDLVCGFIIFTNVDKNIAAVSSIIAAYLLIQGMNRMVIVFSLELPNPGSVKIGGVLSILLGLLVWLGWPFSSMGFLSFVLSAEIVNRSWALLFYARAVDEQQSEG